MLGVLAQMLKPQVGKVTNLQAIVKRGIAVARLPTYQLEVSTGRSIAYQTSPGERRPTVVMVPGLHCYTNMQGQKASCLLRYCDMNDLPCVVYDHEGCGESVGDVKDVTFTSWVEDAVAVIDHLTEGPVVLVGSSLGGWLSILAARLRPERLHGLVLFSPALNYVWPYYQRHKATLPPDVAARLEAGDSHVHTYEFGDALLKEDFAADSRKYEIDLKEKLDIICPVRIIHGLEDKEINPEQSMQLSASFASDDVDLIYRKNSEHELESAQDLELFLVTLDRMIKDNPVKDKPFDNNLDEDDRISM